MSQNEELEMEVIVYGEALPKEKNAYGQDIVIIPVRKDTTNVLPYSIRLTVKTSADPMFPRFETDLTIDGHNEATNIVHAANVRVLELSSIDYEVLGFGPIRKRSSNNVSISSLKPAGELGEITVKVTNCKITKTTEWKNPSILPRRFDIGGESVHKEMDKLELQSTKWKTVSAGCRLFPSQAASCVTDEGPFCQTITLLYTDLETMEYNRRLTEPELIQRKEYEIMKSEAKKSKVKKEKVKKPKAMKSEMKSEPKPKIIVT